MLDWDDLRTFLTVSRHGNLSAAARALKVTQTTMGRRLEALHARAGAKLLTRTPRGFVLTPAGERVLANVERMEAEALSVERAITGEDMRLEGEVRIATVEAFGARIIVPSLPRFINRYPGISVEVDVDQRSVSLSRREADVAVRLAKFEQHEVVVRRAGTMRSAVYASRAYLDRHGMPDLGAGAPGHRAILLQASLQETPEARWFASLVGKAHAALRTNSRDGQLSAALGGMGLACLPCYLADPAPGLVRLAPPQPEPEREIWIGVHRDTRHMPRIRAILDHLAETLATADAALNPPVREARA